MSAKTSVACGLFLAIGVSAACGASGTSSSPTDDTDASASFGAGDAATGPAACGDHKCNGDETCGSCSLDCGQCAACALAPSCSNALGIPSSPSPRPDLDQGIDEDAGPEGGKPTPALPGEHGCENAQLRLRLQNITTAKGGGVIYCIVSATDGLTAEVALTGKTGDLGDGETSSFDPGSAVFWGQGAGLHTTTNNLTITYDCFKVVDNTAWASALGALSKAANDSGATIGGPYGWAFGAASAASAAAAAAVTATNGDDHLFNAQQTIDKSELLDLTNGRTWSLEKSGGGLFSKWDWKIGIESWGCAAGSQPAP
ncbi:MAG: hypothetical protein ABI461_14460 [Polyangiaceae bacterium]